MSTTPDIKTTITDIITLLDVPFDDIECTEVAGQTVYRIKTTESGKLIGTRGETVRALNYLIKKIINDGPHRSAEDEPARFMVDINDYHSRQLEDLQNKARILAGRAKSLKYDVEMTPMSSYERMIIHATLADEEDITTESRGEGRDRKVVIKYTGV